MVPYGATTLKIRLVVMLSVLYQLFISGLHADDVDRLIQKLRAEKDSEKRAQAAWFLGEAADPRSVEPLIAALDDPNGYVRSCAAWALGEIRDTRAVQPLIEVLGDMYVLVRQDAAQALGNIGDPAAIGPLVEVLKDKEESVQLKGACALYKLGYEKDKQIRRIIRIFKNAKSGDVMSLAASVLVELRDPRSAEAAMQILPITYAGSQDVIWGSSSRKSLNACAVEVLAALGDRRAVKPLVRMLREGFWWIRSSAAATLGNMRASQAVAPLIAALKDDHWHVREEAIKALGKIKDPRAIEPLIPAIEDEYAEVWTSAVVALHELSYHHENEKRIERLIAALRDDEPRTRWNAARALGEMQAFRAAEPLLAALKDEKWGVRMYAAYALGEIKESRAVGPLIDALKDDIWRVRKSAAEALARIVGKDFGRDAVRWRDWWVKNEGKLR